MNFYFVKNLSRYIKLHLSDKKQVLKLQALIEKKQNDAARKYLHKLLRNKQTDLYLIAYHLTVGNNKTPQIYGAFLEDFISKTGSSCGHGRHNSDFSPVYWLGFLEKNALECRFIINPLCFHKNPVMLELEIEQEGCFHVITNADYSRLPDTTPNVFRYSMPLDINHADNQLNFSLLMEKPCRIKIYHCCKGKTKNVILQETFNVIPE